MAARTADRRLYSPNRSMGARARARSLCGRRALVVCCALFFALSLVLGTGCRDTSAEEAAAKDVAVAWLSLIDAGQYEKSWDTSSSMFQGSVGRDAWSKSLTDVREPLGKLLSRELAESTFTTQMPRSPEGEYVLVRFETSFEARKGTIERVTLMKEQDAWGISGYFIQ